jgi:hypothetical protein
VMMLNDRDLFKMFIGEKKANYYLSKWSKPQKVSWNWPAFLFAWFWLGYRKMYRHLFILISIFVTIDIASFYLGNHDNAIGISFAIVYGLFGNYFYRLHAVKKIDKLKGLYSSESGLQEAVAKQGGTSGLGILVSIGLLLLYVFITAFIYMILTRYL